jgi:hypothetical protein
MRERPVATSEERATAGARGKNRRRGKGAMKRAKERRRRATATSEGVVSKDVSLMDRGAATRDIWTDRSRSVSRRELWSWKFRRSRFAGIGAGWMTIESSVEERRPETFLPNVFRSVRTRSSRRGESSGSTAPSRQRISLATWQS